MTSRSLENRTIALAGICQSVTLVHRLATTGYLLKPEFQICMHSLLEQNPSTTLDIYGRLDDLEVGLNSLRDFLSNVKTEQQQCFRYLLGVLHLQGKLQSHTDMLEIIGARLAQINQQAAHFDPGHDNVVANLADLYADTISKFRFRIQVRGEACYLQQNRIANQVRALLFAAIRSAILWQQLGGRRWHLLVYRKTIAQCAQQLLRQGGTTSLH
jgi:high frequency lysogenization protein